MTHVIVGAGEAGLHVALALRAGGHKGPVVMLGAEPHAPYTRPPLSKSVLLADTPMLPEILSADAIKSKDIELRTPMRVIEIDRGQQLILCADGTRIVYDKLILATGCRPRRLVMDGAAEPNVRYLRTFDDALAIRAMLRPGVSVVFIGGGYIGLEIAAAARQRGCDVTILEQAEMILSRAVGPEVASFIANVHAAHGVTIRTSARVSGFERYGDRIRIRCADGWSVDADLVVVGVGAEPRVELARTAGLPVDNGILVDQFGRTSDPHIFACGDVANHPNPWLGMRVRLESWQNAQQQATAVGETLAGHPRPYAPVPWYWTDQYDINLQMVGGSPYRADTTVVRGNPQEKSFTVIHLARGRVIAASAVNRPKDIAPLRRAIERGDTLSHELLSRSSVPIVQVLKTGTKEIDHVA